MVTNISLLTDLYQITMANGYWETGKYQQEAVFHLFYRKAPFGGQYVVASGLEEIINYLNNLSFSPKDIQYLAGFKDARGQALFGESFLNYLQRFTFTCDVDAVPEGTVVFPHTPLIRVKGPLIQAQLVETTLLNLFNFSSLITTKATRIVEAAENDTVFEFGLRRAQGANGGLTASRAAYIGGCGGTSNVLAGQMYDIPVKGTHAHSWVMCHETELEAFENYAQVMPNNTLFLVDTYDTIQGVKNAIKVGLKWREKGHEMQGIRLDSGDLAALSITARELLDRAGFPNAKIVASNDLDEYKIKELKQKGAKIDVWGVGTKLATAYEQPALGGVFKLAAIRKPQNEWKYKMKLSEQSIKISNPGILNTWRIYKEGIPSADIIVNELEKKSSQTFISFDKKELPFESNDIRPLLQAIFRKGKYVYQAPNIHNIRKKTLEEVSLFKNRTNYPVGLEQKLHTLKENMIKELSKNSSKLKI